MSLFLAPVQGKVFIFKTFREQFWGLEARKRKKNLDFKQSFGQKIEKNCNLWKILLQHNKNIKQLWIELILLNLFIKNLLNFPVCLGKGLETWLPCREMFWIFGTYVYLPLYFCLSDMIRLHKVESGHPVNLPTHYDLDNHVV